MTALRSALLCASILLTACNESGSTASSRVDIEPPPSPRATSIETAPSFDCLTAKNAVEELICSNDQLIRLDNEVARLTAGIDSDVDQAALLKGQSDWLAARNRCGADAEPVQCTALAYAQRIFALRQGTGSTDDHSISHGPLAVICAGLVTPISATFINADPDLAYLVLGPDNELLLRQQISGSGVRYTGKNDQGEYELWTKGEQALLTQPGAAPIECHFKPAG